MSINNAVSVNYLSRAISALKSLGIAFKEEEAPVLKLLDKVAHLDQVKVLGIATTLQQSSTFNAAVREQIDGMEIAARYANITDLFNSIRDDAKEMAGWMEDGRLDFSERIKYGWMQLRRGSIPDRFNDIRKNYLNVASSAQDQIARENTILNAYQDFRLALKTSEIDAQDVLLVAQAKLDAAKEALKTASDAVASYSGGEASELTRLEMARDEAVRALQDEDKVYQLVKDIADDLKTSYNTAELVFARLQQTHAVKDRLYQRSVTFFSTNEIVFTGLAASFTSSAGLAEATNTMEAMKAGMNQGLEDMATTGGKQLEAGMRSGYGSTLQASSVKALADAVVEFQASSMKLIEELRTESTKSSKDIEEAVESSKRRFTDLITQGS